MLVQEPLIVTYEPRDVERLLATYNKTGPALGLNLDLLPHVPVLLTRNVTNVANLLDGVRGVLLDVFTEGTDASDIADALFRDARVLDLLLRVPEVLTYRLGILVRLLGS